MSSGSHKFQAPKGTRDFPPEEMAVRRHLESVWRDVSTRHGFDEIDGPTFEHLELYTVKSGPGIVSELFSFRRAGGDSDYALRPEFTPTLARMVAARGAQLPKPIRWFCMPAFFRAERPQRGRLREFFQWNADVVGDPTAAADAEIIAVMVGILSALGLTAQDARVRLSHRAIVTAVFAAAGIADQHLPALFDLLDRRDKLDRTELLERAGALGLAPSAHGLFERLLDQEAVAPSALADLVATFDISDEAARPLAELCDHLDATGLGDWCTIDLGIVRGLAYYTGSVFEVHETSGRERALAGGGRYDQLVELFGGPPTPAVGIAMGDVVIRLVLEDRGLLESPEHYLPRPDVYVVSALDDGGSAMRRTVADLRRAGLHVRHSARATKNVGKLLGDAGKARARRAVILAREYESGTVVVKDLDAGEQLEIAVTDLVATLTEPGS